MVGSIQAGLLLPAHGRIGGPPPCMSMWMQAKRPRKPIFCRSGQYPGKSRKPMANPLKSHEARSPSHGRGHRFNPCRAHHVTYCFISGVQKHSTARLHTSSQNLARTCAACPAGNHLGMNEPSGSATEPPPRRSPMSEERKQGYQPHPAQIITAAIPRLIANSHPARK
jgi:hypothetical protein